MKKGYLYIFIVIVIIAIIILLRKKSIITQKQNSTESKPKYKVLYYCGSNWSASKKIPAHDFEVKLTQLYDDGIFEGKNIRFVGNVPPLLREKKYYVLKQYQGYQEGGTFLILNTGVWTGGNTVYPDNLFVEVE